jgi:prepilin-type N-terminal cleavage/methylation domain-containing protein
MLKNRNEMNKQPLLAKDAGFSLFELIIAMTITLVLMGLASALIASAFSVRKREDQHTDALADVQRGLNIMSREIAISGFNLSNNGIVTGDSDATSIRIRANLNKYDTSVSEQARSGIGLESEDKGEDIKYFLNDAGFTKYLVRYDRYASQSPEDQRTSVLANRIDSLRIHYFDRKVTYTTTDCDISNPSQAELATTDLAQAKYVVIGACVRLEALGTPGRSGYQPAQSVLLVSDVALRRANLRTY